MPKRVVLVGAGGIGRRHLESLSLSQNPLQIFIVDPSPDSLTAAQNSIAQTFKQAPSVSYHANADDLPSEVDIAIVATTADVRRQALEKLLQGTTPRWLILEKILFQHPHDYAAVAKLLEHRGIPTWVNCPRRLWPQYQQLRDAIPKTASLVMHAKSGAIMGLASNVIHVLDLLVFLSPSENLEVDASRLRLYEGPNKRKGIEFVGTLVAHNERGFLTYTTLPQGNNPFQIEIELPESHLVFEEAFCIGRRATAADNWKWHTFEAPPIYQSRLTGHVIDQLISEGDCGLTPYPESAAIHLPLIRALADRLERIGIECGGEVRIT